MKKALLIINLGTPESSEPHDVGKYLTEFLTDKYVIDLPFPIRQFLVRALIVPKRKFASSLKYKKIWSKNGSPLLFHTKNLSLKLNQALDQYDVHFAMRYGNPSIKSVLHELKDYQEITVLPLYPQNTKSSFVTAKEEVLKWIPADTKIRLIPPFYDKEFYINSLVEKIQIETAHKEIEFFLFSYHGIPEHHLPKECRHCDEFTDKPEFLDECYKAQCYKTTALLVEKLGLTKDQYMTSFQSRLGKRPWIRPYTDIVIHDIKSRGIKNMAVLSPSFMSDCLETLEELAIDLKSVFESEQDDLKLNFIPCLNDSDFLVKNLGYFLKQEYKFK